MTGTMTATQPQTKVIAAFSPLPWQVPAFRDKEFVNLYTGSAGGGKSHIAAEKVHGFCKKYPHAMGLMLRKTRNSMTNSTVLFMEREVIGPDPAVHHFPSKLRFEYANGSILAYGGMANDEQREQIRSIGQRGGLDIAWLEEATGFTEDDYNEILARMRGRAADWRQVLLSTNPSRPSHWILKRLIEGKQASVYYSGAADNTYNPGNYETDVLGQLTGVIAKRLRDGLWVQAKGAVYDEFDHKLHMVERPRSELVRYVVGVDEGHVNPVVALVIGLDSDKRAHIAEEFYQRRVLQNDFVSECSRLAKEYRIVTRRDEDDEPIEWEAPVFYVDPSAAQLIASMKAKGLRVKPADNAVNDGIQTVKERLATQDDGRPRLTVDPGAVNTISEFESYVWATNRDGNAQDKPVKENDHAMDALRYACRALGKPRGVYFA